MHFKYEGDNRNNSQMEENLFQRREPENTEKRQNHPSGATFNGSNNSPSSSFNQNNSAKVVDYGHGRKQGKY